MWLFAISSALFATAIYSYFIHLQECRRWMKYLLSYVYLRWVNKKPPLFNFDAYSKDLGQLGMVSLPIARLRENPRQLSSHKHAIDSVSVSGVNKRGDMLCLQLSRHHNRRAEVSVYFRLNNGEEYQLPLQPDTSVYNTDGRRFSAAGLTLEVLEPLKRWRINFNGYLRKSSPKSKDSDDIILAKFNLIWVPLFNYVSYPEDFQAEYVAEYLSQQSAISPFQFCEKLSAQWHEQFGQMKGTVSLNGAKEIHVLLRGLKKRTHGFEQLDNIKQRLSIEGVLHNGTSFHIFVDNLANGLDKFVSGYVCPPCNMTVHHMNQCQLNLAPICQDHFQPRTLTFDFTAGPMAYRLSVNIRHYKCRMYVGEERELSSTIYGCDVTLNDKPGDGILRFSHPHHVADSNDQSPPLKSVSLPLLSQSDVRETEKMVVTFGEVECQSALIVGGKGASLSLLSQLEKGQSNFTVPLGLCVTKVAFESHLKQHPHLQKAIDNLQKIACSIGSPAELLNECQKLVEAIESSCVSDQLRHQLESTLERVSGNNYNEKRYAVRSSAIGEDGEELSAAGQNETFLGLTGLDQICSSVVRCWASQFAFRPVEYQRQNGQLLNKGMAVVVQEMVAAEAAGVLFTRDPITGSPDKLFITSNYGLGESVVSASVDPDTIVLRRSWDDRLSIDQIQIGSKKVQLNMSDESGTVEVETADPSKCSLCEDMALRLGRLALLLEKHFGSSRDIEWAMKHGHIYMLQCRPVTTDNPVTEYEITHEYDTGARTDNEAYTTANVGEVFPGAARTITMAVVMNQQVPFIVKYLSWKLDIYKYDPTVNDVSACIFYNHIFIDMIGQKNWSYLEKEKSETSKALEIGIYGRVLDDQDLTDIALERFAIRPTFWQNIKVPRMILNGMLFGKWLIRRSSRMYEDYPVPTVGLSDPLDCLDAIGRTMTDTEPAMYSHFAATFASTVWNLLTLNILSSKSKEFTADQYSDFAILVGSCNGAESGDVPASLEELAVIISKVTDAKTFSTITTEDALDWLQTNSTEANTKFKEFLRRHGHRGLNEFDIGCRTWAIEPTQVVKALQGMLHSGAPKIKAKVQPSSLIDQIKTPLTPFKKFILKWVMKGCRMGVCHREKAKSMFIKACDSLRLAYRQLGVIMAQQGYFTDPELVMFFSHEELIHLVNTRSPKLLRRAKHRQRIHKTLDDYKFPEIVRGEPVPINTLNEDIETALHGVEIKGIPVSQGRIRAPARVITHVKYVHTIQPGEILITHGTDVGWTPYFPMLSGVITELGGLVSHGAVIARECALPCIVGVDNATKLFQTGDIIDLNANEGIITKIHSN